MPSCADVLNPENTFVLRLYNDYKKIFKNVSMYKGNTSDKIYYKAFFDLDERVVDITNLIFISSDCEFEFRAQAQDIEKLGVSIQSYISDLIRLP